MKVTFNYWQRRQLYQMLNMQNIGRAPLGEVAEMLQLREKLDPADLEDPEATKEYTLTLTDKQVSRLHKIANNPQIEWPIHEHAANLHEKLSKAVTKNGKDESN